MTRAGRRTGRAIGGAALLAAALVATGCAGSDPGPSASPPTPGTVSASAGTTAPAHETGPSAGCGTASAAPAGTTDEHLTSGGVDRSYRLVIPDSYDGSTPMPVVFGLHSLTVDYRIVPSMSGFADMEPSYDFIGVSPSGLLNGTVPYWNAAPVADNGDVTYIGELLDHLEATLCVDTARVFSVGMSNGAQLSSLLGCRLPERVTAIAPIAGVELNEPCEGPAVPIIAFHGAVDPIVPYEGGGLNSVTIADQNLYRGEIPAGTATPTGVDESMARWAAHNGCDPEPIQARVSPEVQVRTWRGCDAATVLYIVDNGGHAWPGKPQPAFEASFGHGTSEIDASALLFEFFFDPDSRP